MKNIIITGSNGMIGRLILEYCLQRADVNKVTAITRKKTGITHPKLCEVMHENYLDFHQLKKNYKTRTSVFSVSVCIPGRCHGMNSDASLLT